MSRNPYGRNRYLDMQGDSMVSQMRQLIALKWHKAQQPAPVVKFATADPGKVALTVERKQA